MTVEAIRFRTEGALVVLQVLATREERDPEEFGYHPGHRFKIIEDWRDAKVEDLLDAAKFTNGRTVESVAADLADLSGRHQVTADAVSALAERSLDRQDGRTILSPLEEYEQRMRRRGM